MNKTILAGATLLALAAGAAHADNPQTVIAALDARLAENGTAKLQGTDRAGDKTVAAIYFGQHKINNSYELVDDIRKTTGATATVFVRQGGDYVQVSTNAYTPAGQRGVGTTLPRAAAYAAVSKGQAYCGTVEMQGTSFDACFEPIKDAAGQVIGATYVGLQKFYALED